MPFGWILVSFTFGHLSLHFLQALQEGKGTWKLQREGQGRTLWEITVLLAIHSSCQLLMSRAKGFWLRPPLSKNREKSTLSSFSVLLGLALSAQD